MQLVCTSKNLQAKHQNEILSAQENVQQLKMMGFPPSLWKLPQRGWLFVKIADSDLLKQAKKLGTLMEHR